MHVLMCFFVLKLFPENLRTNAELFMRYLSWLEASWVLEDSQHRIQPTTEVTRDSRGSCSSGISGEQSGKPGPRQTQLSVLAGPPDFFLTQQKLHMILQSPQQNRPAASPLP